MSIKNIIFRTVQVAISVLGVLNAVFALAYGMIGEMIYTMLFLVLIVAILERFRRIACPPMRMPVGGTPAGVVAGGDPFMFEGEWDDDPLKGINPSTGFTMDNIGGVDAGGSFYGEK